MTNNIIDGKRISLDIRNEIKTKIAALPADSPVPTLAVIMLGENPASAVYVRNKKEACKYTGIKSISYELPASTSESELISLIKELNQNNSVSGILVQLPLPDHIEERKVLFSIDPHKDVDCFHPYNVGCLGVGLASLLPCTPAGIIELLKRGVGDKSIAGKNCVVIGRSNIVGKPVAMLLLAENATVTVCHSKTVNLSEITARADILVAAVGKPRFVTADMVKEGAVVIDVGIHRTEGKKLCGDVDFKNVSAKAGFITPVPGGVGPVTISMLMKNCFTAFETNFSVR